MTNKRTLKPTPARGPGREKQLVAMLRRKRGVSLEELVAAFGVKPHSARAMVSVFGRRAGGVERRDGRYRLKA